MTAYEDTDYYVVEVRKESPAADGHFGGGYYWKEVGISRTSDYLEAECGAREMSETFDATTRVKKVTNHVCSIFIRGNRVSTVI